MSQYAVLETQEMKTSDLFSSALFTRLDRSGVSVPVPPDVAPGVTQDYYVDLGVSCRQKGNQGAFAPFATGQ